MSAPLMHKAVGGIQTILLTVASFTADATGIRRFRVPQGWRIYRIAASIRASVASSFLLDVKAGVTSLLTTPLELLNRAAPAAPVSADAKVGGAVELGTHSYKTTFVTAVGETMPSAKSNVVTLAAPDAPVAALVAEAGNVNAGNHSYKVTFVNAAGESVGSAKSNVVLADGGHGKVDITLVAGPAGTTSRKIYRTVAGDAGAWKLLHTIADNVTLTYQDNKADGDLGADIAAAAGAHVAVTGIAVGPAGTTKRRLYRTVAGDAGDYLLVVEIADNVTTTYDDNTADGALGAAAPAANTANIGEFLEASLTTAAGIHVAKETEITVDGDITGTSVDDLSVQIDFVPEEF